MAVSRAAQGKDVVIFSGCTNIVMQSIRKTQIMYPFKRRDNQSNAILKAVST
uniref:Uncharacterized protein n=1 Tax=Arundo donax TaxID=35708 RepID=A0A0A8YJR2_ARUDO